jgi:hypothetical protein
MSVEDRPISGDPVVGVTPLAKYRKGDRAFRLGRLLTILILAIIVSLTLVKLNYP